MKNIVYCIKDDDKSLRALSVFSVRRSLDIPSVRSIVGTALSHSGTILVTDKAAILIDYMSNDNIYVNYAPTFTIWKNCFRQDKYVYYLDFLTPQIPNQEVTIQQYATTMAEIMAGKKFNTWLHNCHQARYYTMKHYGIISSNPDGQKLNIFFQGWVDFFNRNKIQKIPDKG